MQKLGTFGVFLFFLNSKLKLIQNYDGGYRASGQEGRGLVEYRKKILPKMDLLKMGLSSYSETSI